MYKYLIRSPEKRIGSKPQGNSKDPKNIYLFCRGRKTKNGTQNVK